MKNCNFHIPDGEISGYMFTISNDSVTIFKAINNNKIIFSFYFLYLK